MMLSLLRSVFEACTGDVMSCQNRLKTGLTRVELLVLIACLVLVGLLLLPLLRKHDPVKTRARRMACAANCRDIGKAMAMYRQDNGGYFPFLWSRCSVLSSDPMASIGLLYPQYLEFSEAFRCLSTDYNPVFVPNPDVPGIWRLVGSSYGYDCRVSPQIAGGHVILGDMDGTWGMGGDTSTQNHEGGQNVLYADGGVVFKGVNYCSDNPEDNIFVEDPWHADTDSFISDDFNPLSISYDDYPDLHP